MKKLFITLLIFLFGIAPAFSAGENEALAFFNSYVEAANSYNKNLTDYYSANAIIKRIVVRPDGTKGTAVFTMKDYATQMKIGETTARMRNYKNYYTNRKVTKHGNNYKITCLRQPSLDNYKLPAYFVVSKASGSWKIVEEGMETKVQIFDRYVRK